MLSIRVSYLDDRPADESCTATPVAAQVALRQWVTEEGTPESRRRVARVDAQLPADILRDGMVMIDTPGIGSALRHDTDAGRLAAPA